MSDMNDKIDKLSGKAKEAAGEVSGDDELADEGRGDQAKADAKDALKQARDKLGEAADEIKDRFKK